MTRTSLICLITLIVFSFVSVDYSLSEREDMDQRRPNKLDKLYFIPKTELIVGGCDLGPNGSIKFWSVDDGKLVNILDLEKRTWANTKPSSPLSAGRPGSPVLAAMSLTRTIPSPKALRWATSGKCQGPSY